MSFNGKKLQFVEPYVEAMSNLQKFKKMNLICAIYVFDVSKESKPIEEQLENFMKTKENLKNLQFIPIANKIDVADPEKIKKLEAMQSLSHEIPVSH